MNKIRSLLFISLLVAASSNGYAKSPVEDLSPQLRSLLKQEMVALQEGMKNIVPAFASGDLKRVATIAGNIRNSFIMKQALNKSQKHELHEKLPNAFIKQDQQFHQYAGMLEHVSQEHHIELVGFYYSKLLESCIACHSEYALHRFPELSHKTSKNDHHH